MYIFIVNLGAGGGRGKRVFHAIKESETYQSIKSISYETKYKGHAEELVRKAIKEYSAKITAVIVIGGDGTLYEVVNGLENEKVPLGFIPGGSANDFARGCSINKNPVSVLKQIVNKEYQLPYWTGTYKVDSEVGRVFTNNIGFGFDAQIAQKANNSRYKKSLNKFRLGKITYIFALIQVLLNYKPFDIELIVDNKKRFISRCWMVTVTNHPFYGGGMKIIPESKIEPDFLPVLLIHSISKWKLLFVFITVFKGKHVGFKEVELLKVTHLTIKNINEMAYQVDGETGRCFSAELTKQNDPLSIIGTDL